MEELNIDTTVFDEEYERQELERTLKQKEAERQAQPEEASTDTPQPEQQTEKKEEEGEFLGGMMEDLDLKAPGEGSINDMGGTARSVAGTIDTVMDLTSKFIPAMQGPADFWDEKSGRKTEKDPLKKAERDAAAIIMPMLLTGGLVGAGTKAAGLTGKTKLFADAAAGFGLDALITGVSDTTSEAGNLSSLAESALQQFLPNASIPLASRDSDSPDTIYDKNFIESLLLGGLDPIITGVTALKAGNKIIPKDDVAQAIVETIPEKPGTVQDAILRNRAKKKEAQLREGIKVLAEDPDGAKGYNAFVNEPAEASARTTIDESGNTVEFMADNVRIQNNVGTQNGRARPMLDNDTQELLARADAATRADLLE